MRPAPRVPKSGQFREGSRALRSVRRRREAGESLHAIATDYGVTRERIRQLTSDIAPPKREPRLCSVEGCERRVSGRGYCALHYRRVMDHGEPGSLNPRKPSTCPQCGSLWGLQRERCPECGISRFKAFPRYRIPPTAGMWARLEMAKIYRSEYLAARHEALAQGKSASKAQNYALTSLARAHPRTYHRLYQQRVAELREILDPGGGRA
jgi:hypothetical protein